MDRRTFLQCTGAAVTSAAGFTPNLFAATPPSADLALMNGVIITLNQQSPVAQAMAVRGGRILAVGSEEAVKRTLARGTNVLDLKGKCVSPGLIDAHSHVIGFGQMQLKYVLLRPPEVYSFETLNKQLALAAKERPPGEWIVGRGFNTFKEGRFPRRREIDEAVPDRPVLIIHWSGQFGVANTLALKKAKLLSSEAKDPYGGKYLRDAKTGVPDGVLLHYPAIYSVYQPELQPGEQLECAEWGMRRFAAEGVTCIHDNFCHPRYAAAYVRLEQQGRLPCRVRVYPYVRNLEHCRLMVERVRRYEGPLVRMQGIKLAVDGYALMYEVPAKHRQLAIPMHPEPQFNEIITTIHRAGLQTDVHAVGDKGVDWTLAAFTKASGSPARCRERRHRIEHFPFRKMDSIKKAADLGVPVCLQPNFIEVKADDFHTTLGRTNKNLVETMLPVRTFIEKGVHIAYGADVPAFPSHSPVVSIRSAMERKTGSGRMLDRSEAVSFMEAFRHHTVGGAYAAFDESDLGTLETGKCADFVIWNRDLRTVETAQDTLALKVHATYLGGKAVFADDS